MAKSMFKIVLQGLLANPAYCDYSEEEIVRKATSISELAEAVPTAPEVTALLPAEGWSVGLADGSGGYWLEAVQFMVMDRSGQVRFFELSRQGETVDVTDQPNFIGCWHASFGSESDRDDFFTNEAEIWAAAQMEQARKAASVRRVK